MNIPIDFINLFSERGLVRPTSTIADDRFHRCDADRLRGKNDGSYLLNIDHEFGIVQNWSDGQERTLWFANSNKSINDAGYQCKREGAQQRYKQEEEAKHQEVKERATKLWQNAAEADPNHPYLISKGITPVGIKQTNGDETSEGQLIIPIRDSTKALTSLQFISITGQKWFLSGGKIKECYLVLGKQLTEKICLCEGYATGVSIYIATGLTTVVAFNCGNLKNVGLIIREKFPEKTLIYCADNDAANPSNPGIESAIYAARITDGLVATPKFKSEIKNGGDFNDLFLAEGAETLKATINKAEKPEEEKESTTTPQPELIVLDLYDLLKLNIEPKAKILPWMPTQSLSMIYAWRGVGKTHVALGIAYAIASGGSILGWQSQRSAKVLYVDGEMPAISIQERIAKIVASADTVAHPGMLSVITPDLQAEGMPDLATDKGQTIIDNLITDHEVIIIDNLSCLVRGMGRENEAESWGPVQQWALKHRRAGRSILFIHHSAKSGQQRGTSKKEDILDTVICLKRPSDYNPSDGAVFEVHFEKARHVYGDETKAFEAQLIQKEDRQYWQCKPVEDTTFARVVALANEGLARNEMAEELDVNKSTISRHMKRATAEGLVTETNKSNCRGNEFRRANHDY